jgi:hypothetical protein
MNLFRQSELNSARLMTSNVKTRQSLHGQKLGSSLIELVNIYISYRTKKGQINLLN